MALTKNNRFVDNYIPNLRRDYWNPIVGYRARSTLSLEQSVESLVQFVDKVKEYAEEAKIKSTKSTQLTINESAAVYLYTMKTSFYERFNQTLRTENPPALEPWLDFLKLLINGLAKLPSCKGTLWRGVANIDASKFSVGDTFTWWSVTSCSSYASVAAGFTCDKGILFCINTIHGKDIKVYSEATNGEEEVILMPGTSLRVKDKTFDVHGFSVIHLEEWLVCLRNVLNAN